MMTARDETARRDRNHDDDNANGDDEREQRLSGGPDDDDDGPNDEEADNNKENDGDDDNDGDGTTTTESQEETVILYKSPRLKGYLTLTFSSVINLDAAVTSDKVVGTANAIPPDTDGQQSYAFAVAFIGLLLAGTSLILHVDHCTPLERVWIQVFRPRSKIELLLVLFQVIWWSVAVGIQTAVNGIAGDGKGQYSLYFSCWASCITSYWILERWFVAAGWDSLKQFVSSWPYRAPGWLCIFFLSFFTLIWYIDLWQNHEDISRPRLRALFESVPDGQFQWLIIVTVFTIIPACYFVLVELFRETKQRDDQQPEPRQDNITEQRTTSPANRTPRGTNGAPSSPIFPQHMPQPERQQHDLHENAGIKGNCENVVEGVILLLLVLAWIPTVMVATTPGGAAALTGNAYFFTWVLVIFIFETAVWHVHDVRKTIHKTIKDKSNEYHRRQRAIYQQTKQIREQHVQNGEDLLDYEDEEDEDEDDVIGSEEGRLSPGLLSSHGSTEFFDVGEEEEEESKHETER